MQYAFNGIYLLLVNLYRPKDNFNFHSFHVITALIRKVYEAQRLGNKTLHAWGDGSSQREFLYSTDAARGIVMETQLYSDIDSVDLGKNHEIYICNLVKIIGELREAKEDIA